MEVWLLVVAALVAVVGLIVALKLRRRGSAIVLFGPSSGKTALYFRLKNGSFVQTVASMRENEGTFAWQGTSGSVRHTVDIPGHGRLRWRLKDFLPVARSVVFMVDATAVGSGEYVRETAAMMLELLGDAAVSSGRVSVLVACNKNDALLAHAPKRVKATLEKEVAALGRTRTKDPTLHEGAEDGAAAAGPVSGEGTFSFDELGIKFVSISVKKGELKELFEALGV